MKLSKFYTTREAYKCLLKFLEKEYGEETKRLFIGNLIYKHSSEELYFSKISGISTMVDRAFMWAETEQGSSLWERADNKWREIVGNNKIGLYDEHNAPIFDCKKETEISWDLVNEIIGMGSK